MVLIKSYWVNIRSQEHVSHMEPFIQMNSVTYFSSVIILQQNRLCTVCDKTARHLRQHHLHTILIIGDFSRRAEVCKQF